MLTTGKHTLRFEFGGMVRYAYNDARPWWNESWKYRKALTVSNGHLSSIVRDRYSVNLTLDTQSLVTQGKLSADCSDLRITWYNGSAELVLPWVNETGCNSTATQVWFPVQRNISAGSADANYSIYYGFPGAEAQEQNRSQVYWVFEDFEDGSHPFSSGTMTASVSASAAKNGGFGLVGDGAAGYRRRVVPQSMPRGLLIEGWINSQGGGATADMPALELAMSPSTERNGYQGILDWRSASGSSADMQIRENFNTGSMIASSTANTVAKYAWYYVQFYQSETGALNMNVWNASGSLWGSLSGSDATYTSGYYGVGAYRNGYWDDIKVRLYLSTEPSASLGSEEWQGIDVTLEEPVSGQIFSSSLVEFNCSGVSSYALTNVTLYGDWSGSWEAVDTALVSGTSAWASFSESVPDGVHVWNCLFSDADGQADVALFNGTFQVDTTPPGVVLQGPSGTVRDVTPRINMSLLSAASRVWYSVDGGPNTTLCTSCSSVPARYLHVAEGVHTLRVYANDSVGNLNDSEVSSFTVDMQGSLIETYGDPSGVASVAGPEVMGGKLLFEGLVVGWWDAGYAHRMRLNVTNNDAAALEEGYSINVSVDALSLVQDGKLQADCDDLRVVFFDGSSASEIDRVNGSACNASDTQVWFSLQELIPGGGSSERYYLYYGNPSAGAPPDNRSEVFLFYDDFQDGDAAGWTALGGTWSVADGAYRQSADTTEYMHASAGSALWGNYSLEVRVNISSGGTTGGFAGVAVRFSNTSEYYAAILDDRSDPDDSVWLRQWIGGSYTTDPQEYDDVGVERDVWMPLRLDVFDDGGQDTLRVLADGIWHAYNFSSQSLGAVSLFMHGTQGAYDDVVVRRMVSSEPSVWSHGEVTRVTAGSGNMTSKAVNTTKQISAIEWIDWDETGTNASNNVTVRVSANGGGDWCAAQKAASLDAQSCASFVPGDSLVYQVFFVTQDAVEIGLDNLNITWVEDESPPDLEVWLPVEGSYVGGMLEVLANASDAQTYLVGVDVELVNASGQQVYGWSPMALLEGDVYDGVWNATIDTEVFLDGIYNVSVRGEDVGSNVGFASPVSVSIDNTAPSQGAKGVNESGVLVPGSAVCVYVSEVADASAVAGVTAKVTQSNGSSVDVSLADDAACAGTPGDGIWGGVVDVGLVTGSFVFNESAVTDAAGNVNVNASPLVAQVGDAVVPDVVLVGPAQNSAWEGGAVALMYQVNDSTPICRAVCTWMMC
ncbi:MAG: DUF2341 domain-containing protein [Nitrosarchaeum sp.]|nr:DUF2341 domain-containing protein [Nitrosarchaeum sp.]